MSGPERHLTLNVHLVSMQSNTHTCKTYHEWKLAIVNYWLVNQCLDIIEGIDTIPYQQLAEVRDNIAIPIVCSTYAGSVAPSASETMLRSNQSSPVVAGWKVLKAEFARKRIK